jgi:hypothetical protein
MNSIESGVVMNLRENMSFGFEQTFTIPDWWTEPGFTSTSDTPKKREKMLDLSRELAAELKGKYFESKDVWDHMQYEVTDESGKTQFYVTMDPGSIEVKTPPCLVHETLEMARPLFIAAQKADVVAYRNWWYGVKAGTEGGCHVNMGGHDFESNPLLAEPELVVKYAAYVHNRPWLHHPFMGLDVGPEGNAMRMDEKPGYKEVKDAFKKYNKLYQEGKTLGPQETYDFFKNTNLITEKGSYPSLYKFKEGLFLIEDRGQESLRCAEDFLLVSELRMQIFEKLQKEKLPEDLQDFPNLHTTDLTSLKLWQKFQTWASEFNLETQKFKRFFERQFPNLCGGENVPTQIKINDGRRPRVITEVHKRGDVVTGKSVDTSYKRFEIYTKSEDRKFQIEAQGIETISEVINIDGHSFCYLDIKYNSQSPLLNIHLKHESETIETGTFNIHNMTWE